MKFELISLFWICLSSVLWGAGAYKLYFRLFAKDSMAQKRGLDENVPALVRQFVLVTTLGLCVLTVFAEYFSLFGGVGMVASVIVLMVDVLAAWFCRREIGQQIVGLISKKWKGIPVLVVGLALGVLAGLLALTYPQHYDTYLYHAQAIRWIEEYGVVPGLGNLHNRLAYNSSFMCLQALFSLKWLSGISHHTVNGFWMWLMSFYAIAGMKAWHERKFFTSDVFRVLMLFFLFDATNLLLVSSPGTDLLALGLLIFLVAEWVGLLETKESEAEDFALICILSVYAVTVKLSVTALPLLILCPLVSLIRKRKWKKIGGYVLACIAVGLPFLIRNVLISGYLIYPYPQLDLFSVDWKMPAFTALFDRYEIRVWGQRVRDIKKWDAPIRDWFPIWYENLGRNNTLLLKAHLICVPIDLGFAIFRVVKNKDWRWLHLFLVIFAGSGLWLVGSPDIRYGGCYLGMMPALGVGMVLTALQTGLGKKIQAGPGGMIRSGIVVLLMVWAIVSLTKLAAVYGMSLAEAQIYRGSHDYSNRACLEAELDGVTIYYPETEDQTGYDPFPSTPYVQRLDLIELRGDSYKQGFRMKEEYRDQNVTTYGYLMEDGAF